MNPHDCGLVVEPLNATNAEFVKNGEFLEQGNLKLDESCISNPKAESSNWTGVRVAAAVQFTISDLGFEMQDSSNFKFRTPKGTQLEWMCSR
jgi:hypothetical protein